MKIKIADFREEHLALSDVWTWSDDLYESEDSLVPVPVTEEALANAGHLLIGSALETARGDRFQGWIMYNLHRADIFALAILTDGRRFGFNKNLASTSYGALEQLAAHLGTTAQGLLPIKYEVTSEKLDIPSGTFSF
jgi:hypothetical protein